MIYLKILTLCYLVISCYGNFGVDLSIKLVQSDWLQLETQYATTISSASLHVLFYNQTINPNAPSSLISASTMGIKDLSVYMHPCIPGSNYDKQTSTVTCTDASSQFQSIYKFLTSNKISFKNHTVTGFNTLNLHSTHQSFQSLAIINRIFINLEDEVPSRYFNSNKTINHIFLSQFIDTAYTYGIEVGIYTTKNDWQNIMPQNVLTRNPYNKVVPLWIPRYDGLATLDFFRPFNGWNSTSIIMKQITGGSTESRRLGSNRICTNYVVPSATIKFDEITLQAVY